MFHLRIPIGYICILLLAFTRGETQGFGQAPDLSAMEYRCVGPARGGRVTAVAGIAKQPSTFYMGTTGGGVWKTEDYGTSWFNISDGYFDSPSVGAIRVVQSNPDIIFVGTGSDGLRSNVISGKGLYKSEDAGHSWKHLGLTQTGHIGAIEIHPENPQVVFVAAIGQAFQANEERGVFRTTDGGEHWEKVLYLSDTTGFADLEFKPGNPNVIYATAWRAERKPWTIISGGEENGIYRSVDGGHHWEKIDHGLPGLKGKIDLAVSPAQPDLLYALVEADGTATGLYRSEDGGDSFEHVSNEHDLLHRAFYYTNVDADPLNPNIVYVCGKRYFKSIDGGQTWSKLKPPHADSHDMWINPENPQLFIQANDGGANVTHNGGKTWSTQFNQPTAELYQVEIDDQYPYWLYAGQQDNYTTIAVPSLPPRTHQLGSAGFIMDTGGCETGPAVPKPGNPNIVYSNCKGRFSVYDKLTGQERQYSVGGSYMYGHNPKDLSFRFQRVSPIHVSPHDPDVIYHTSQYVHRSEDEGKNWQIISPDLTACEADKQVISGSPISRDITGEEFYSTIYAIRESKIKEGVIWVGANDGPVHVTKDAGQTWKNVTPPTLPPGGRVDCVEPSPHDPGKAYISVLRYQLGDWQPYIYKTTDYGASWSLLTTGQNGIPADYPTRVVREDPIHPGLLYAGTEFGVFISFDDGQRWQSFQQNLPITPVTDIKLHREDLVLSTMGRSFWILDNISSLHQQLDEPDLSKAYLFKPKNTVRYRYPNLSSDDAISTFPNYPEPSVVIDYYLPEDHDSTLMLEVLNDKGVVVQRFRGSATKESLASTFDMSTNRSLHSRHGGLAESSGLHRMRWDMRHFGAWEKSSESKFQNGPMVSPGTYLLRLVTKGQVVEQSVELLMDPRLGQIGITRDDLKRQEALNLKVRALLSSSRLLAAKIEADLSRTSKPESRQKLEALQALLVRAHGRYTQPMLISQIEYLAGLIDQADQLPGEDVYIRFEELNTQLAQLQSKYQTVKD
ncbi:MAG: hypothetical protein HRU41_07045 [Saprospiraceae bacterium]|nr:hypothetical protein [Saprospiraceae bacterium]